MNKELLKKITNILKTKGLYDDIIKEIEECDSILFDLTNKCKTGNRLYFDSPFLHDKKYGVIVGLTHIDDKLYFDAMAVQTDDGIVIRSIPYDKEFLKKLNTLKVEYPKTN